MVDKRISIPNSTNSAVEFLKDKMSGSTKWTQLEMFGVRTYSKVFLKFDDQTNA